MRLYKVLVFGLFCIFAFAGSSSILAAEAATRPATQPLPPKSIVFVCQGSGSMMSQFDLLRTYMAQRIQSLNAAQKFNVLAYHEDEVLASEKGLLPADAAKKQAVLEFLNNFGARGTHDPVKAIKVAVSMHPDVIYLVGNGGAENGDEVESTLAKIRKINSAKVTINTVLFGDRHDTHGADFMVKLASEYHGVCVDSDGQTITSVIATSPKVKLEPHAPVKLDP